LMVLLKVTRSTKEDGRAGLRKLGMFCRAMITGLPALRAVDDER
jgi:hypothetical protein